MFSISSKVSGQFSRFSSIKCLNFSNNNITEFNERAFLHLHQLQLLDLSANSLIKLPSPPTTAKVDIRGNLKVSCKNVSSAIDRGVEFLFKDDSLCEVETVYYWFNSTGENTELPSARSKFSTPPSYCVYTAS